MNNLPLLKDLSVYISVVKNGSFIKTADTLGVSPAYISKRIQILEKTLKCTLLHRNTRSIQLTENGSQVYDWAVELLANVEQMTGQIASNSANPSGLITITSSLGFGRQHIAPIISELVNAYPSLSIRFDTVDKIQDLVQQQIDLDIRVGNSIASGLIAKPLCSNKRVLCASPEYLNRYGNPIELMDLLQHQCLVIKERDHPFGLWQLDNVYGKQRSIKVAGHLASNNGEMVRLWALAGHGIMLRSLWNIEAELKAGTLIQILPDYWQDADIWAVYPMRLKNSAKLRVCVNFFEKNLPLRITT